MRSIILANMFFHEGHRVILWTSTFNFIAKSIRSRVTESHLISQQPLTVRIHSLNAMDHTVIADRYSDIGVGDAVKVLLPKLKASCHSVDGCFSCSGITRHCKVRTKKVCTTQSLLEVSGG